MLICLQASGKARSSKSRYILKSHNAFTLSIALIKEPWPAASGVVPAMAEEQGRSPVAEQEPGRKNKGKKQAQLLRAARQQERQAGSDDEDLPGAQSLMNS